MTRSIDQRRAEVQQCAGQGGDNQHGSRRGSSKTKRRPVDRKLRGRKRTGLIIKSFQFPSCSFPFTSQNHGGLLSSLYHTSTKLDLDLPSGCHIEHAR